MIIPKFAVSRLIGAPPGYIGYEEGGQLTEAVRRQPYSVVLFDEIEKAHPDVFNILLQVLDDGHITDSQGRQVNFKNTVIIMTSNIGSQILLEKAASGSIDKETEDAVQAMLRQHFRPEFLNRIDEIILFRPLNREIINRIIDKFIAELQERLIEQRITLQLDDQAKEYIARYGYEPQFGARPLRRFMQRDLETKVARSIIAGEVTENDRITVTVENDDLHILVNR